ncbi:hypothetical protein GGR54DRAFT_304086 [Hypoxylon sp. NC1633]|nr:hypothetical protein GGR54DRAFT_304086 [Hypoxylon sp. NC1633]
MATTTTTFRKTTLSHAQKTVLAMSRAQYLDAIRATRPADKLYVGVCIFRMDAHSSRPSVLLLRRSASSAPSSISSNVSPSSTTSATTTSSRWRKSHHNRQSRQQNSNTWGEGEDGESDGGGGGVGGIWELPGGKVREGDFCISAAVARRVAEQTGLRVVRVLGALQDLRRLSEVRILDWDNDGVGIFSSGDMMDMLDGATLTSASGGSSGGSSSGSTSRRSPIHSPQLVLRKECLQLNYAVLVQSHEDLAIRSRDHDELVWASFSRAEMLPMPEELRTVVHQGLAFAGEYLF